MSRLGKYTLAPCPACGCDESPVERDNGHCALALHCPACGWDGWPYRAYATHCEMADAWNKAASSAAGFSPQKKTPKKRA